MLTAPSVAEVDGVTVWGDDTFFYKFYLMSAFPRIRLDKNDDPVISMVQYVLSAEDRAADPTLPAGGGYLNFDVAFSVTPEETEAARAEMQLRVDAEWNRRKSGTSEERNSIGVKGTTEPPRVEFASPSYTGGSANLYAPQSEHLVQKQVAHGTPDLMAGNVAVFSMDLTAAGSVLLEETLTAPGGADLTPLQVGMTLEFPARIPPVNIEVTAESERIYDETRKFLDGEGVDACTTYDFQQSDINTTEASFTGLIDVKIDPGSSQVSDEVLEELRQYALDMMQQLIESSFFTEDPSQAYYPGFEDEIPPQFLEEEAAAQRGSNNSKKYLKNTFDKSTMDVSLHLTQSSVVTLTVNPQSTLQTFFAGRPPTDIARFVRKIRLADDMFRNRSLEVRVFGEFAETDLEIVEVQMEYSGVDFDGSRVSQSKTLTFTDNSSQTWVTPLIGSEKSVRYRYRTKNVGAEFGPLTEMESTESNALNIAIETPGKLERKVVAGALNFDALKLHSVQVDMKYEDDELGSETFFETLVLTKVAPEAELRAEIGFDVRKPVQFKRRFVFISGDIEEDDDFQESESSTIFINQQFQSVMEVRLLPVGRGWSDVIQVTIELFYKDAENGIDETEVATLKTNTDLRVWSVRLKDPTKTGFTFRVTASYANGDHVEGELTTASGAGVLPIAVREPETTNIEVISARLDFEASPISEVVLFHSGSGTRKTMTFDEKKTGEWTLPVRPNEPLSYSATITHFPHDRDPLVIGPIEETDTVLVLPPYKAPEAGTLSVRVMPSLIDFTETPVVVVDLLYEDEENDVSLSHSVGLEADAGTFTWEFPVKDIHRRLVQMTRTYFVAPDNQPVVMETEFTSKSLIVLPPFRAEGS